MKLFFSIFMTLFWIGISVSAPAKIIDRIVAIVNDDVITQYDVDRAMAANAAQIQEKTDSDLNKKELERQVLEVLINQKLLEQEIEKANIQVGEEALARAVSRVLDENGITIDRLKTELASKGITFDAFKEQLAGDIRQVKFIQQQVASNVQVTEKDVENFKSEQAIQHVSDMSARASWLFLKIKPGASDKDVKKLATRGRKIAERGRKGISFQKIIRKYGRKSIGSFYGKKTGESLKSMPTAVASQIRKMNVGSVSDPVVTPKGIYIVKLYERKGEGAPKVAVADDMKIRQHIYNQQMEEEIQNYLLSLRRKAFIEIRN